MGLGRIGPGLVRALVFVVVNQRVGLACAVLRDGNS